MGRTALVHTTLVQMGDVLASSKCVAVLPVRHGQCAPAFEVCLIFVWFCVALSAVLSKLDVQTQTIRVQYECPHVLFGPDPSVLRS